MNGKDFQCDECREVLAADELVRVELKAEDGGRVVSVAYCCPYCDDVLYIRKVAE